MKKSVNWLDQTPESYNSYYKTYRADWCRKSSLPMFCKNDFELIKDRYYTITRAKKAHISIEKDVSAWYRTYNGYVPMFCKKD